MAHRILGLDIGQRRVKVAVVDKSVRQTQLIGFDSEPVACPYGETELEAAIRSLLSRVRKADEVIVAGMPATDVLHRVLSFPFQDRKAIVEAAAFELETHIPVDLEESVIDHIVVGRHAEGCEALVVAAPRARVQQRIELLRRVGAEPRQLGLVALSLARLLRHLPSLATGTTLVLDIGAAATDAVVAVDGAPRYVRALSVGADAVRADFADQFDRQTTESAADLLVSHGLLLPPGMAPATPDEETLHKATLRALAPWLREVRQTMAAWRKGGKPAPDRIVLTGGMAGLRGLVETLEAILGLPVRGLPLHELEGVAMAPHLPERLHEAGGSAVALALEGALAQGGEIMDFRQGDLAFEGDYKYLRERLPALISMAVFALCLLAVRSTITYRGLVNEQQQQVAVLVALSKEVTGKKLSSFDKLQTELKRPLAVDLGSYYPDMSAIKVLDEVSRIQHEVTEPPEFKPGGPGEAAPPNPVDGGQRLAQVVAPPPQLRGLPPLGMTGPPTGEPTAMPLGMPPSAAMPPAMGGGGMFPRPRMRPLGVDGGGGANPGVGAGGEPGADAGSEGGGEGGGQGGAPRGDEPFTGHKIELLSVDIDRSKGSLRGDCDTQEALLAFQTALEKHPCFQKIKSTSDRITFERHREWFRFNIGFEIQCPAADPPKKVRKADGGDKAGSEADGEETEDDKGKDEDEDKGEDKKKNGDKDKEDKGDDSEAEAEE